MGDSGYRVHLTAEMAAMIFKSRDDRIAELEAALKPLAQLEWSKRDDQIDPRAMYILSTSNEDADLIGADILKARKLVEHLLPKASK